MRLSVIVGAFAALPLSACLTPIPDKTGYEVNGSRVRWVGITMGSVLAEVHRVNAREADAATFRVIDHDYAVDTRHVFWKGSVVTGENPVAFKVLPDRFAIGSLHVYHNGRMLLDANPTTWRRFEGTYFSTDGVGVWYNNAPLEGVDAATFRVRPHLVTWQLHSNEYSARDDRNFYRYNLRIGSVDDCVTPASGGSMYWGREELAYLCNDLQIAPGG